MASEFTAASKTSASSDYRSSARYIFSHVWRQKVVVTTLMIGAFSNAALASVVFILVGVAFRDMQLFADGVLTREEALDTALLVGGAIVLSQFVRALLQFMRNFSAEVFAQRIERDVRDELYASLLGKSMTFHDMQPTGEIMARVTNDVRELNFFMNPGLNLLVGSGMFLLVPLLATPFIEPQLMITPAIFVVLHLLVQYRLVRAVHPIAQEVRASFGRMNARLAEALEGLEVVKGTAQEDQEIERFDQLTNTVRDYYIRQGAIEARYLSFFLLGMAFVGALLHATLLYQAGTIGIDDVVAFIGQIYLFGFPVFVSLFSLSRLASGYASAGRILDIINTKTELDQNQVGYEEPLKGEIEFQNVTFGYMDGTPVLKDVSFSVKPGQTVALVGQTGSGKSTITKLINRTYDVDQGRVLVDGVEVRDWKLESLRSQISIIEQDIFLFSRTISENIAFAEDHVNQETVESSAKKAQAHDFIMSFPKGYDTVIGQRGVTLSGGQRQRLAIARAFEHDPPVLILDDSTSAIDSATEDQIQKAIWTAAEGRTTILITHRLSQIRWADHIVVIKQGRVAAQGTHESLLETSEAYQRIFARYDEPEQQPVMQTSADKIETE